MDRRGHRDGGGDQPGLGLLLIPPFGAYGSNRCARVAAPSCARSSSFGSLARSSQQVPRDPAKVGPDGGFFSFALYRDTVLAKADHYNE